MGISYVEKLQIVNFIETIVEGKNEVYIKKGCLFLIQALLENFKKIIEPYTERILFCIMQFFGDNNEEIRNLSLKATKTTMSNLSAFGVKIMLPILLKG